MDTPSFETFLKENLIFINELMDQLDQLVEINRETEQKILAAIEYQQAYRIQLLELMKQDELGLKSEE